MAQWDVCEMTFFSHRPRAWRDNVLSAKQVKCRALLKKWRFKTYHYYVTLAVYIKYVLPPDDLSYIFEYSSVYRYSKKCQSKSFESCLTAAQMLLSMLDTDRLLHISQKCMDDYNVMWKIFYISRLSDCGRYLMNLYKQIHWCKLKFISMLLLKKSYFVQLNTVFWVELL